MWATVSSALSHQGKLMRAWLPPLDEQSYIEALFSPISVGELPEICGKVVEGSVCAHQHWDHQGDAVAQREHSIPQWEGMD